MLPHFQGRVIALGFKGFVGEVLDGFVVEQAVDRSGIAVTVGVVGFANVLGAPTGRTERESSVKRYGEQNDQGVLSTVAEQEDARDHHDLKQGGRDVENEKPHQKADAIGAPLNIPSKAAGATVEVIIQIEAVDMAKYGKANPVHGFLRHPPKQRIPQLGKNGVGKPGRTVGKHHQQDQMTAAQIDLPIQTVDQSL